MRQEGGKNGFPSSRREDALQPESRSIGMGYRDCQDRQARQTRRGGETKKIAAQVFAHRKRRCGDGCDRKENHIVIIEQIIEAGTKLGPESGSLFHLRTGPSLASGNPLEYSWIVAVTEPIQPGLVEVEGFPALKDVESRYEIFRHPQHRRFGVDPVVSE